MYYCAALVHYILQCIVGDLECATIESSDPHATFRHPYKMGAGLRSRGFLDTTFRALPRCPCAKHQPTNGHIGSWDDPAVQKEKLPSAISGTRSGFGRGFCFETNQFQD